MTDRDPFDVAEERGLIADAIEAVVDLVKDVGEAAERDGRVIASAIMADMVKAKLAGRRDLVRELEDQTKMLVEMERLRAVGVAEVAMQSALRTAAEIATRIATRLATGGLL